MVKLYNPFSEEDYLGALTSKLIYLFKSWSLACEPGALITKSVCWRLMPVFCKQCYNSSSQGMSDQTENNAENIPNQVKNAVA